MRLSKEEIAEIIKLGVARREANARKWHSNVRAREQARNAERRRQAQYVIYDKVS